MGKLLKLPFRTQGWQRLCIYPRDVQDHREHYYPLTLRILHGWFLRAWHVSGMHQIHGPEITHLFTRNYKGLNEYIRILATCTRETVNGFHEEVGSLRHRDRFFNSRIRPV